MEIEMTRDEIAKEFDLFFEFDTEDRSIVTSVSARLFAERIAALAVASERDRIAAFVEDTFDFCGDEFFVADVIRARGEI